MTWTWARDQYTRAEHAVARHGKRGRARRWIIRGVIGVVGFALGYSVFGTALGAIGFIALVGASAAVGGVIGQRVQIALRARKFEKRCLPKYASIVFVAGAAGVHLQNGDTEVRHAWSAFDRWVETDEFFLIMWPAGGGYYVPKSAMSGEDHRHWRSLLGASLGASAATDSGHERRAE